MATVELSWKEILKGPQWRVSPHLLSWQKSRLRELKARVPKEFKGLWLLSSGTSAVDELKAVALTFEALHISAEAVNRHLEASHSDNWLLALPLFHVGGLGVLARAHFAGSSVQHLRSWSPQEFTRVVSETGVTLSALVPTQIFDLVTAKLKPPSCLRAIVVGGSALPEDLYLAARSLGWPLLPSYGLTECSSQVATAELGSLKNHEYPRLKVLGHVEVAAQELRLKIRSEALATWIARAGAKHQFSLESVPQRQGWFLTEDLAEVTRLENETYLRPLGRRDEVVKILGEMVFVSQVEQDAKKFFHNLGGDLAVIAIPSSREGHQLWLVTDSPANLREWTSQIARFNSNRPGPERLTSFFWRSELPRTALGKIRKARCQAVFTDAVRHD